MAADIVERPDLIIQAAADYDRLAQLFEQLVGSRLGQFRDMSRGKPCLVPDMLHFQIKKLRVDVASGGDGRARWEGGRIRGALHLLLHCIIDRKGFDVMNDPLPSKRYYRLLQDYNKKSASRRPLETG